jgi:ParB/RepB/Spo0J family partition protein
MIGVVRRVDGVGKTIPGISGFYTESRKIMSTGTGTTQAKASKEGVLFLAPDDLILDRDWNGRWTKVADETPAGATDAQGKHTLPEDSQRQVSIRELATSIKELGQLEDVLVCKRPASDDPDGSDRIYHVVAGQSRTRALALLASEEPTKNIKVRCRLLPGNIDDRQAFLINEEENRQRNNLSLLDKAYCMKREKDLGFTANEIATRWGYSVQAVGQALSLIELPEEVKEAVYDRIITATVAIENLRDLKPEAQIEVVNLAREAKIKGTPFRPGQIKELVRQRVQPPAATLPAPADGTKPADGGTTPATTATPGNGTAPVAPQRRGRGRPAGPVKKQPRSLADFRKVLQGRDGVLSQSISRYLDGYPDIDDGKLIELLDTFEFADNPDKINLAPRTEGNPVRPDPDAEAFADDDKVPDENDTEDDTEDDNAEA